MASSLSRSSLADGAERLERAVERLAAEHGAVLVVELVEARVDPDRERVRAKQPAQKPWMVEIHAPSSSRARSGAPALDERGADARAQLAGRLARVGDDEHRLDVEALVADGADEPLDEHRRLARCRRRPRRTPRRAPRRRELLLVHAHARATRHIVQRSHQVGHSPPFGSCATSPARIRRAASSARSRAVSTWPQNCSSSR